jgi:hypothetical protein
MALVETPEIARVAAVEQECIVRVSRPHIVIYEPANDL